MKNRLFLSIISLILVLSMALSACGSADTPDGESSNADTATEGAETTAGESETSEASEAGETTEAAETAGGEETERILKAAYSGIADTLDPFICQTSIACNVCNEQIYCSLLMRDENHAITFYLSDNYDVNEDGTLYNFHIREDATFSNGDAITPEDVKFSIETAAASSARSHYYAALDKCEVVDGNNIKVTLKYNDPLWLSRVATPAVLPVVSQSFYEAQNGEYGTSVDKIVSSGAYIATEWVNNVSMTFKARDDFWGETSNIKDAIIYSITDTNGLMVAMQTGDIDLSWSPVTGSSYQTLSGADGVHFTEYQGSRYENIYMYNKSGTFSDVRMRQAVAYAVNPEEALIVGIDGMGFTIRYPGDNASTTCNPDYDSPNMARNDIEKARALVEECGNTGLHVVINSYQPDPYPALSTWLQSVLNSIGLDAEVQVMERGAWLDASSNEQMEIGILCLIGSSYDMDDDFCNYVSSSNAGTGGNLSWYLSDEMDALIAESRTKVDNAERTECYKAMIDLMWKDVPLVPLFCWNYALPTSDSLSVPNGRVYRFSSINWVD